MQGKRTERLGGQIQQVISEIILLKVRDPRLGFVTVTGVKMSPDLKYANIYITVLGADADAEVSLGCLENASGFIRSELGGMLHVKHVPELRFRLDDAALRGRRIENILKDIKDHHNGQDVPQDS